MKSLNCFVICFGIAALLTPPGLAADVFKADNTTVLTDSNSWTSISGTSSPTTPPGASDIAVFDSTIGASAPGASATITTLYGGDLFWGGIRVGNPHLSGTSGTTKGYIISGTGNVLTLGASGIDMSAATRPFEVASAVTLSAN